MLIWELLTLAVKVGTNTEDKKKLKNQKGTAIMEKTEMLKKLLENSGWIITNQKDENGCIIVKPKN